jgi:2-methylcitrate dehydratase
VRVWRADAKLGRESELAWKIAAVAADPAPVEPAVAEMVGNRLIDDVAVAIAAVNRDPVVCARQQALLHPRAGGAGVLGLAPAVEVHCEWAAWANATAVRELDFHDNVFAAESGHPGDSIPPLLAVAQQCGRTGADLVRAIATSYEIQVDLAKAIALNTHRIDHVGHLGPAVAAGLGALLGLPAPVVYQAVNHAAHVSMATRQGRKGQISSWKANAPGHVGKLAIEAIDRAMRGEVSPAPVYEGDYGIVATLLDGPDAVYAVPLPEPGEPKRAILETFTKEHSAGYHGQAIIDLAFKLRPRIPDPEAIASVVLHTKRLTHVVMGSGANDPEKMDPGASRETLDHSAMFQFAVALEDGVWHHERSYAPERVRRPGTLRLWRKIRTVEDPAWTRRYEEPPPLDKHHGARAVVTFADGRQLADELAVADAHPRGARPFARADYARKFHTLTGGLLAPGESERFLGLAARLPALTLAEVRALLPALPPEALRADSRRGIF